MSTIFFALAIAIGILALSVGLQIMIKRHRDRRLAGLELRPNCLLTRYPIAFIGGRRSPFRLFDHWNAIPRYLREHGYDVMVIDPPTTPSSTEEAYVQALASLKTQVHVIADSGSESILEYIADRRLKNCASLTIIKNPHAKSDLEDAKSSAFVADRGPQIRLDLLKPRGICIETFEVAPESTSRNWTLMSLTTLILIMLHNAFAKLKRTSFFTPVDPFETGAVYDGRTWTLESRFLDLAISLAERDARWCD